ncbi:hypothetical protein GCM10023329_16890 [Streptomyces sanyensis]|uniref:Uncharacterized protein n=1 Tax=Streptomyces sanyensis TaxID=568869 RepID=A0ABP8ZZF3_9ACTN
MDSGPDLGRVSRRGTAGAPPGRREGLSEARRRPSGARTDGTDGRDGRTGRTGLTGRMDGPRGGKRAPARTGAGPEEGPDRSGPSRDGGRGGRGPSP